MPSSSDRAGRRSRGATWGRLALSAGSLLVCLAGLEGLLRVTRPHSTQRLDIGAFLGPSTGAGPRLALIPGATNPHFMGGPVRINRDGLRGPELEHPKPEGTLRILAVGDSNTFGYGVAEDEVWHQRVATALTDELGAPVEAINAGLPGAGFAWQYHFLRARCLDLEPDLVLLGVVLNDIVDYPPTALDVAPPPPPAAPTWSLRSAVGAMNRHSYLSATVYRDVRSLLYEHGVMEISKEQGYGTEALGEPSAELEAAWARSEELLSAVNAQARACGVPVVWVVFPVELQLSAELLELYRRDYRLPVGDDALDGRPQARLKAHARSLDVPVVDLLPRFKLHADEALFLRDSLLTVDPVHPSVHGHAIAADEVIAALRALPLGAAASDAGPGADGAGIDRALSP